MRVYTLLRIHASDFRIGRSPQLKSGILVDPSETNRGITHDAHSPVRYPRFHGQRDWFLQQLVGNQSPSRPHQ